jgi:hypothetical protein
LFFTSFSRYQERNSIGFVSLFHKEKRKTSLFEKKDRKKNVTKLEYPISEALINPFRITGMRVFSRKSAGSGGGGCEGS